MTGSGSYAGSFISRVQLMSCKFRFQIVQLIAFLDGGRIIVCSCLRRVRPVPWLAMSQARFCVLVSVI